jgi:hypothetical protein
MMAGRARGAEHVVELRVHHRVHPANGGADAAVRGLEACGVHPGVGVERLAALLRRGFLDHVDVSLLMGPDDVVAAAHRRVLARQGGEHLVVQHGIDGPQPVRPLGMPQRRFVLDAHGMGEQ